MKVIKQQLRGLPVKKRLALCSVPDLATGCRLWTNHTTGKGYGQLWVKGKNRQAHRVAYEEYVGPIPEGLCVLHRCDTPACINPNHLFLGTHQDNVTDRVSKGRSSVGEMQGQAKLTEKDVELIVGDLIHTRLPYSELAGKYSVSSGVIGTINNGSAWKHMTEASRASPIRKRPNRSRHCQYRMEDT